MNAFVQRVLHDEESMGNVLAMVLSIGTLLAGVAMLVVVVVAK